MSHSRRSSGPPRLKLALFFAAIVFSHAFATVGAAEEEPDQSPEVTLQQGEGLQISSADDTMALAVRGYIQLYYDWRREGPEPDHSSFSLRRLRPDIQGHIFTEDLTFRLMPEFATVPALQDGWVSYRFGDGLNIRGGQFNIPFNWERHVSSLNHQFSERSVANNEFQWLGGRDIGLMAHGDPTDWFRYGVGIFGGQGANVRRSDTTGHLFTGRAIFTPVGEYPDAEVPVEPADQVNLSFAAGAFYTDQNSARDWAVWHPAATSTADVLTTTADAHLQWSILSVHLAGFYRDVTPGATRFDAQQSQPDNTDPIEAFTGVGATAHAAAVVWPQRLAVVTRFSESRPNLEVDNGRQRQILGGIHLFHRGLDSRFQLEGGMESTHDTNWTDSYVVHVDYQLVF